MAIVFDEVVGTVDGESSRERGTREGGEQKSAPGPHALKDAARQMHRLEQRKARVMAD